MCFKSKSVKVVFSKFVDNKDSKKCMDMEIKQKNYVKLGPDKNTEVLYFVNILNTFSFYIKIHKFITNLFFFI